MTACRFCASEMKAGARFCLECEQFQRLHDRLLAKIDLSILTTLLPLAVLAFAFLNQKIVRPYSDLSAHVARCTSKNAVLALSNSGTRDAIVESGSAIFTPPDDNLDRALNPPGDPPTPIVVKQGQAQVQLFEFADPQNLRPMTTPRLADANACQYNIRLNVLEFGGRRATIDAGQCKC